MSKIRIISIFIGVAALTAAGIGTYQYTRSFYDVPGTQNETDFEQAERPRTVPGEAVFTGTPTEAVVQRDTEYIMEKYNISDYTLTEQEIVIPVEMLGLNREELIEYVGKYELSPSIEDKNDGFVSAEVISFSEEKIIIRKNYEEPLEREITGENCYILVAEQGSVTVYLNDYSHLYAVTDIEVSRLSEQLQAEIMDGKILEGDKALYDFLEAYTS